MSDPWAEFRVQPQAQAPQQADPWAEFRAPQVGTGEALYRGGKQGLTLGAGDEITGAMAASGAPEWAQTIFPGATAIAGGLRYLFNEEGARDAYDKGLSQDRARNKAAQEQHPIAYTGAEIAGGVLPVVAGGAAAPMAVGLRGGLTARSVMSAGGGAATGATQGFLSGEGGLEQRRDSAASGAKWGAGVGAAAPVVGKAVGAAVAPVARTVLARRSTASGYSGPALNALTEAFEADNAVGNVTQRLRELGPDAMLLDGGTSLTGKAAGVAQNPGEARSIVVGALRDRQTGANARLATDLDVAAGAPSVPSQIEAQFAQKREAVRPLFEKAISSAGPIDTAGVMKVLGDAERAEKGVASSVLAKARQFLTERTIDTAIPSERV